ncbi:CPBP family intramembrane glutamic endopeptidase [Labrenzia sp. VG12]|uniref:CPBP family intramembrane glutamic endopeptidase n=1 Tax=Labrenzia sp. VG12 TaxID=2021862 RepID=UPI001AD9341B|nr:CPBP family intramembrane glutamic endopeptidase [Labrenzia sp. VG12]
MTDTNSVSALPSAMTEDIVASSRDGILTIDPHGKLTSFNPGAEAIFGLKAEDVVGLTVAEVFLPLEDLDAFTDCVLEAVRQPDKEHVATISLKRAHGVLHLSVRAVLLHRKGSEERIGVLVMLADESERVELLTRTAERERERAATGRFIVAVLTIFSVFTLLLEPIQKLAQAQVYDLGPVIALLTLVVIAFFLDRWASPGARTLVLNLRPERRYVIESIVWSLGFCGLMTVGKFLLIAFQVYPTEIQPRLFSFLVLDDGTRVHSTGLYLAALAIYLISVLFQQFAIRCAIQAPLQSFLTGVVRQAGWIANLVSTLLFAVLHAHLNPIVSLAVIAPSILWGWLFMRSGSVVTPILSHAIIGVYAIFILGIFAGLDQV